MRADPWGRPKGPKRTAEAPLRPQAAQAASVEPNVQVGAARPAQAGLPKEPVQGGVAFKRHSKTSRRRRSAAKGRSYKVVPGEVQGVKTPLARLASLGASLSPPVSALPQSGKKRPAWEGRCDAENLPTETSVGNWTQGARAASRHLPHTLREACAMPTVCKSSTACESFCRGQRQSRLGRWWRLGWVVVAEACKERDRWSVRQERNRGAVLARAPGRYFATGGNLSGRALSSCAGQRPASICFLVRDRKCPPMETWPSGLFTVNDRSQSCEIEIPGA